MAYSRSVTTRASLLAPRYRPSISYIPHDDDDHKQHTPNGNLSPEKKINHFLQSRCFGTSNPNTSLGFGGSYFRDRRCFPFSLPPPSSMGFASCRNMSTAIGGGGSEKIEYISDVAEVLSDTTVDVVASQTPVLSEVAVAAADSIAPVAALQYIIDYVHCFTGLNWWASIAVTTILIRGATIPLLIHLLKATSKLTLMRPRLDAIRQEIERTGMHPKAVAEGRIKMQELFKEYGVTPFAPLKGVFIQGPIFISFYLAITNMVQKVPSFKDGGAFWFTDLTTPDSLWIFPVLTGLTFWLSVEFTVQTGLEGNPVAGTMKKVSRVIAIGTVFLTQYFWKAVFCYWVTSNLFTLAYGLVIKRPEVKKHLGIPEIPMTPPTAPQPQLSWSALLKKYSPETQEPSAVQIESSSKPEQTSSPDSVLNERIGEGQEKGEDQSEK